jgi:hypothetical protein
MGTNVGLTSTSFMRNSYMRQVAAEAAAQRQRDEAAYKKERERGAVGAQLPPLNFNLEAGEGPVKTPNRAPHIENVDGGRRKSRKSKKRSARKTRSRRF